MLNIQGCYVALVTPFNEDFSINYNKLHELIECHIRWGTSGLVAAGITGECATLTPQERKDVIQFVVEKTAKRTKVLAGVGASSTNETIENTQFAKTVGADGVMVITPPVVKPSRSGIIAHFAEIDKLNIPFMIYNASIRAGVNISCDIFLHIAAITKNFVAIKQANGDVDGTSDLIKQLPQNVSVMSGDDSITLPILSIGGKGVVSTAGNFIPFAFEKMIDLYNAGKVAEARNIHAGVASLSKGLLKFGNPTGVKYVMNALGFNVGSARMPMTILEDVGKIELDKLLNEAKAYLSADNSMYSTRKAA